jgi:hypothetical protein
VAVGVGVGVAVGVGVVVGFGVGVGVAVGAASGNGMVTTGLSATGADGSSSVIVWQPRATMGKIVTRSSRDFIGTPLRMRDLMRRMSVNTYGVKKNFRVLSDFRGFSQDSLHPVGTAELAPKGWCSWVRSASRRVLGPK